MTLQEMLTEIGDVISDPGGNRFDATKKSEILDRAQERLIHLLSTFGRQDLVFPLLKTANGTLAGGIASPPTDFFAFQRNKNNQPIVEVGGKIARPIRDAASKDALADTSSVLYADEDSPAFYMESGGVVPLPEASVKYHYIRQPKKLTEMTNTTEEECELPRNLHPVLVQDAIAEVAKIDERPDIEGTAIKRYYELLRGVIG